MLFVNLKANLGNNLFQYSFLREIAANCNHTYYLSGDFFQLVKYFDSDFRVIPSLFRILTHRVFRKEVKVVKPKYENFNSHGVFIEEVLKVSELELSQEENYILDGWFQYYSKGASCYVSYKEKYLNRVIRYLSDRGITSLDSYCCIHLRYKDYFTTDVKREIQYGWVLPIDYYQNAIKLLQPSTGDLKFIVVSDDINLARKTMSWLPGETLFSTLESPILDMILISLCQYKVISNSTFSWWGAHLSTDAARVLCPKYLIRAGKQLEAPGKTYPEDWTRIPFSNDYSTDEIKIYNEHLEHLNYKNALSKKSIRWRVRDKIRRSSKFLLNWFLYLA
jgi:hypothetical protein